jgi:glycosyltransferase involved in cell wall biosynthesis
MHILVICPYPLDTVPGQRLKYEQYLDFLRSQGYSITVHSFFDQRTYQILYRSGNILQKIFGVMRGFVNRVALLRRVYRSSGVYIFLNVAPLGPPWLEWLYLRFSRHTIYDIDDMVHMLRTTKANRIAQIFKSSSRYFMLMRGADHVITCTPALDELARRYNSSTTDISSTINTSVYMPVNTYINNRELVIGWSGSHSTAPYLHLIDDVLLELRRSFSFKLLVMGANGFELSGVNVELVPWSASAEVSTLQRIDIGVYPLPCDTWVQGKSGLKALQYMALGIPTVATAIGCNDRIIEDGVSGFLVSNSEQWIARLSQLLSDPELRYTVGKNARERVERFYSVEANRSVYLSVFESVYGTPNSFC